MTTTLTVRITEEKKRLARDKASPMSLSAWVHGLIDRELKSVDGVDWDTHFEQLEERGLRIDGHPDDELRKLNR